MTIVSRFNLFPKAQPLLHGNNQTLQNAMCELHGDQYTIFWNIFLDHEDLCLHFFERDIVAPFFLQSCEAQIRIQDPLDNNTWALFEN